MQSFYVAAARVDGVGVEKINLPFFYQLGSRLNPLTQLDATSAAKSVILITAFRVRPDIRFLLDTFATLSVCRTPGETLIRAIDDIWNEDQADWSEPAKPEEFQFRNVITMAKEFETVLSAELQTLATYHATQKGIYDTVALIERTEGIFPDTVIEKIKPEAVEEIRQTGRCLAFDNATASAFHVMRATEAILHEYYIAVCKPKPKPKGRLENWGAYLKELRSVDDGSVKEVVAIIQQIKDRHRNLIMHPEIVLSPDEAFTLFEIAQGGIIAMADQLPKPKKKRVTTTKAAKPKT